MSLQGYFRARLINPVKRLRWKHVSGRVDLQAESASTTSHVEQISKMRRREGVPDHRRASQNFSHCATGLDRMLVSTMAIAKCCATGIVTFLFLPRDCIGRRRLTKEAVGI